MESRLRSFSSWNWRKVRCVDICGVELGGLTLKKWLFQVRFESDAWKLFSRAFSPVDEAALLFLSSYIA
eukprot:scaffold88526_cov34-Attheya_sp.AAC.1